MPIQKQTCNADEIEIYDETVVYKHGEYWRVATTQRYIDLRPAVIKAAVE